jgi:outer membrane protein assembly factor BamA
MWGLSHQVSAIAYFGNSQLYGLGYYIPWIGDGQKIGMRLGAVYSNSGVVEYASVNNERQMLYEKNSFEHLLLKATFNFRPGLYNYGKLRLEANTANVSDTMLFLSPNYLPGGKKKTSNMNLYVDYAYDSRNSKSYPLKGNYLKGFMDKRGLGILSHDVDYFYYGHC